jgi:hypothetical protein
VGSSVDAGMAIARLFHGPDDHVHKSDTLVMILPLFITNMVATSLIGYKTWCAYSVVLLS